MSVFEAIEKDGQYRILMPPLHPDLLVSCLAVCYRSGQGIKALQHRPLYEVTGDVVGLGSDGEPVLANCRVVALLSEGV